MRHARFVVMVGLLLASTRLSAQPSSPNGACDGFQPSFGLTRQTTGGLFANGQPSDFGDGFEDALPLTEWAHLFGADFPARTSSMNSVEIQPGSFIAVSFFTDEIGSPIYGGSELGNLESFNPVNQTVRVVSISLCPGDFSNELETVFCRVGSTDSQFMFPWALAAGGSSLFRCALEENTTYYLNLAHVDTTTGTNSCQGSGVPSVCRLHVQSR